MALLHDSIRSQLRPLLDELPRQVELGLSSGPEGEATEVMAALLGEMVELSSNLVLTRTADAPVVEPGHDRSATLEGPVLTVSAVGEDERRMRFLGVTGGNEFGSLVSAIQHAAAGRAELAPATVEALGGLSHRVHLQVFTTPT